MSCTLQVHKAETAVPPVPHTLWDLSFRKAAFPGCWSFNFHLGWSAACTPCFFGLEMQATVRLQAPPCPGASRKRCVDNCIRSIVLPPLRQAHLELVMGKRQAMCEMCRPAAILPCSQNMPSAETASMSAAALSCFTTPCMPCLPVPYRPSVWCEQETC